MCQVLTEAGTRSKVIKLVIIDFDLATRVDTEEDYTSSPRRTGTVPFMAMDLLRREWGYMLYTPLSVQSTLLEGYTGNGSL